MGSNFTFLYYSCSFFQNEFEIFLFLHYLCLYMAFDLIAQCYWLAVMLGVRGSKTTSPPPLVFSNLMVSLLVFSFVFNFEWTVLTK